MRPRIAVISLLAGVLGACAASEPPQLAYAPPDVQPAKPSVAQVGQPAASLIWNQLLDRLNQSSLRVDVADPERGIIVASYSGDPEPYVTCGRILVYDDGELDPVIANGEASFDRVVDSRSYTAGRDLMLDARLMVEVRRDGGNAFVEAASNYVLTKTVTAEDGSGHLQGRRHEVVRFDTGERAEFDDNTVCQPTGDLETTALDILPRTSPQLAYVWAHEPDTASYLPSTLYNRSLDGTARVRRSAIGVYEVEFGAMLRPSGANVQVTSYGDDSEYCTLAGWGAGAAGVRCFTADGKPGDANFSLLVVRAEPADASVAYALADQPTRPRYDAPAETVHNVAGPVQISRAGTGQYALEFGEIAGIGANVQVTAVGAAGERCMVVDWTEGRVQVACTQSDGQPGDAAFSVLVVRADGAGTEAAAEAQFIYLRAPDRAEAAYAAPDDYTYDPDHQIRVTRSSPGRYAVRIGPVIGERGGNAQVTAYGAGNQRCKIERWFAQDIEVRCFDQAGQPANSPFSLLFARAAGD